MSVEVVIPYLKMSAESQRSRLTNSACETGINVVRCMPKIVPPQTVNDRSIIDSVAGFINDVTLQGQAPLGDSKDHILWVRFENAADISDPSLGDDWELDGGIAPPLLLILGYVTGVQVWVVPANGEASEVLSWRNGSVKCLRVLPTPTSSDHDSITEPTDQFTHKRPLIALCDSGANGNGASAGMATSNDNFQYCAVNFISLKDGETVKSIKFKSIIVDILANRSSIVVTFPERIAVFDARTLEDRITVTSCHPSPGLNPNPVALGSRWIAYAERRLIPSKRSSGGCEGDGVTSYTATVLNAAKSFGKGLREFSEHVAAGLTGSHLGSSLSSNLVGGGSSSNLGGVGAGLVTGSNSNSASETSGLIAGGIVSGGGIISEGNQAGVVTVLDIKHPVKDVSPTTGAPITVTGRDPIVAHFIAHSEAIIALEFDASGMLLLTADKRGHDFHVFRIQPHPSGSSLAAVHHLYVLHRGDTSAKVQDVAFSCDSRWVAVSTLRGTTHVFPITPYGGPAGVRTHGSPHVVNRLSRFHRSAGLSVEGRSSSPVSYSGDTAIGSNNVSAAMAYSNPRSPPFPHPTIIQPLAQLRQSTNLIGSGVGANIGTCVSNGSGSSKSICGGHLANHQRQRNSSSSSSDDSVKPLRVCATFAKARSWLLDLPGGVLRDIPAHRIQRKPVDSLFIMAAHGALIQYDLEPKHASGTPKEKVCDDTAIELEIEAKAQWCLQRQENASVAEIQPPLALDNWLIKDQIIEEDNSGKRQNTGSMQEYDRSQHSHQRESTPVDHDDRWLSHVEIITHAGPHRRLWMGPQFMFKTYSTPSGSPLTSIDAEAVEIGTNTSGGSGAMLNRILQRSHPMNMHSVGVDGFEQSPRIMNMNEFRHHENLGTELLSSLGPVESQLREDLADAMRESPLNSTRKDTTGNLSETGLTFDCNLKGQGCTKWQEQHHQSTALENQHTSFNATGLSSMSSCSSTSIYSSTHSLTSICDHQNQQGLQQQYQQQHHQYQCSGSCRCKAFGNEQCIESFYECMLHPVSPNKKENIHKTHGQTMQNIIKSCPNVIYCQQQQQYENINSFGSDAVCVERNTNQGASITIAKVVNPLGTVTTISTVGTRSITPNSIKPDDFMQECIESYLHENCDEALFRPVVTVHYDNVQSRKIPTQEIDMMENRSNIYHDTSINSIECSSVDSCDKGKFMFRGNEEQSKQSAFLVEPDLIVPVIEEKNLSSLSSVTAIRQQDSKHEQLRDSNIEIFKKNMHEKFNTRKKSLTKIDDTKDLKFESERSDSGKACDEFENIELPKLCNNPLRINESILKKERRDSLKEEKDIYDDSQIESLTKKLLISTNIGSTKTRKKSLPVLVDSHKLVNVDRKVRRDLDNFGNSAVHHIKNIISSNKTSDKQEYNLVSLNQKGFTQDTQSVKNELINPISDAPPSVLMYHECLLPSLESLKIDDIELFGEDSGQQTTEQSTDNSNARDTSVIDKDGSKSEYSESSNIIAKNQKMKEEKTSNEEKETSGIVTTSDLDNYYDPVNNDQRYKMLGYTDCSQTVVHLNENIDKCAMDDKNDENFDVHQLNQLKFDMQEVLSRGNIMLAMCSSLREVSESIDTYPSNSSDSTRKEQSENFNNLNECDANYSLFSENELDLKKRATYEKQVTSPFHHPSTEHATPLVGLLFSASEKISDEDVTDNLINNDQDKETGHDDVALTKKKTKTMYTFIEPDDKVRRWHYPNNSLSNNKSTSIIMTTMGDPEVDSDDEDEKRDEGDDGLEPLIAFQKTSSYLLSDTTTIENNNYSTSSEGSLLGIQNEMSVSMAALPIDNVRCVQGKEFQEPVHVSDSAESVNYNRIRTDPTVALDDDSTIASSQSLIPNSNSSSNLDTSLIASSITTKTTSDVPAGSGNGGNGKKKSKKKRK
ncbi:uncharacterized protein LOC1278696 isoform X4 [Anopheles gambiae]|uniref:uncharacterized protein LOC1278696 isoform X4 n=1 Tax=Anopheles gambiae TaxID=7165 RepID=UPI002AC96852|nr:uncharacterized protein LOC1278696 isoform X4 [Anopheles gambiae]